MGIEGDLVDDIETKQTVELALRMWRVAGARLATNLPVSRE